MPHWTPSKGIEPTNELMDIITCDDSVAVLASAGSGKTELLAQKANYLFLTDKCAWPKRILSLTFKTEAQINIKDRVNKRCGIKATRFDSYTFHAFSKSIVDRFKNIIPEAERPINNYDIVFRRQDADKINKIFMGDLLVLATRILRAREDIRTMFAASYAYVFVDEFQDTTNEQYNLLQLLFQNTDTKILTVGDINQSIMLWAGARKTVFTDFLDEFSAKNKILLKNYRASNEIQGVLEVVLKFIENPNSIISEISTPSDNCSIHVFSDEYQEAIFLANSIRKLIKDGIAESEICILTKQHSSKYTEIVRTELTRAGINNLDMTDLQDALKEPLGQFFSLFLKALVCPEPKVMTGLFKLNLALNKVESDDIKEDELTTSLVKFISQKQELITATATADEIISYIQSFVHSLGVKKIKGRWRQYKSPEYFNHVWTTLEVHLRSLFNQARTLKDIAKLFSAESAVHIMNIHKCKGLEYDAVYFVGLEDQAFWNYINQPFEDNCAIYVALSRAKRSICVTFSKYREHRIQGRHDNRRSTSTSVKPVIDLLRNKCKFTAINHTN